MKNISVEAMKERFEALYHKNGTAYFAPGRVNLIGEHTDYNGGHVFPCALSIGTYAVAAKREDRRLRFYSLNFEETGVVETDLDHLIPQKEAGWTNYPKGMMSVFAERGMKMDCGMDLLYYGNLPNGSGLSSSASIEVLTGYLLAEEYGFTADGITLAKLGQYSENHFNGMHCGIMDQFAVAMGKEGQAIYLNTEDLTYSYVPVALGDACLMLACSNKKRSLTDSKYNERRAECEEALRRINRARIHKKMESAAGGQEAESREELASLGQLTTEELCFYRTAIGDETLYRRARHAVSENERTLKAVSLLRNGDIAGFGALMNDSHRSLRDDYEVTGIELDTLAETAWTVDGVIGSRMTGAGFGGCTVSLVRRDAVDRFREIVSRIYLEKIGYEADFYMAEIGGGPEKI